MWGQHFNNWTSNFCGFGPSFGHGPWMFGWIFPLLFWGIIIFVVFSIIKSLTGRSTDRQDDIAMSTLRNRFASGEINEKEFADQKAVLNGK